MIKLIVFSLLLLTLCNEQSHQSQSAAPYDTTSDVSTLALNNRYSTGEKYLTISNVQSNIKTQQLTFEVAWDGSWRMEDGHDAAWIFIKMQSNTGLWQHVKIRPESAKVLANHSSDSAEPTLTIAPDSIGLMIYRKREGAGDNHWQIAVELLLEESDFPES
ncbi:MAG: hypothetical protein AAF599_03770 [Bacteroidota bacterium]